MIDRKIYDIFNVAHTSGKSIEEVQKISDDEFIDWLVYIGCKGNGISDKDFNMRRKDLGLLLRRKSK